VKDLLNFGQMLSVHARLSPGRVGARDLDRAMTFAQWNERACRLANALIGLGLAKGDRVAILSYNCVEWCEIYAAAAKSGVIALPINFRLTAKEVKYIIDNAEAAALIVQDELVGLVEEVRGDLSMKPDRFIRFGATRCPAGYRDYETLLAEGRAGEPDQQVSLQDPWTLMYTSGTTGHPKGVVRSHRSGVMLSLVTEIELGLNRDDGALLAMPMCHANSLNFFGAFSYRGGVTSVYSRSSFDPEHYARTLAEGGSSFTSLVPTHYIMMLGLSDAVRGKYQFDQVTKLMISSAPARPETKREVMAMFPKSGLYELYGATETGWVTMLHPHEQFTKLGSVGRECVGAAPIRLLDETGHEVQDGQAGELYSCNAHSFDYYWRLPEKTRDAFRGDYCSVGDMARRDADGYIHLSDRKSNMIISGGENVYPSEIEALLGAHPKIRDVAVIGLPDDKWGERVHAVIVLRDRAALTEAELIEWSRHRMAGYKRPRSVAFVADVELPRNATGKVLHRELKARFSRQTSSP
jgi:acyl-CoA synthetase (AMP-forming)/AMP-acid ligase II